MTLDDLKALQIGLKGLQLRLIGAQLELSERRVELIGDRAALEPLRPIATGRRISG